MCRCVHVLCEAGHSTLVPIVLCVSAERALRDGLDVVVGTPGRVIDHMDRGTLSLAGVEYAILDEADEMLNFGFQDDIEKTFTQMPKCVRLCAACAC